MEKAAVRAEASGHLKLHASLLEFFGRYPDSVDPPAASGRNRCSPEPDERAGETRGIALATSYRGCAPDRQGDHGGALVLLRRALEGLENRVEPGHRMAAAVRIAVGLVHRHPGETEDAIRRPLAATAALSAVAEGMWCEAQAREQLADIARRAGGRPELVRECLSRAADIHGGWATCPRPWSCGGWRTTPRSDTGRHRGRGGQEVRGRGRRRSTTSSSRRPPIRSVTWVPSGPIPSLRQA
ncbi:hypothetical protein ACE1SV_43250 [Streptomyces sennicomposti]